MKKIIVFLVCVFAVTSVMAAEPTCNGGSTITANNGTKFCKSDKAMNWWSAFTWCESQRRTLANFSSMCPGVSQALANEDGDCPNLQGTGDNQWVWSSLAYGSDSALLVNLSSGAVANYYYRHHHYFFALCEQFSRLSFSLPRTPHFTRGLSFTSL